MIGKRLHNLTVGSKSTNAYNKDNEPPYQGPKILLTLPASGVWAMSAH